MQLKRCVQFCLLCLIAMPGRAASKPPVATVTDVRGAVEIRARGAAWQAVKSTATLAEGAAVRVGKGGHALLLQPHCPPRALEEGAPVVVSASKRWLTGVSAQPLTTAQYRSMLRLLSSAARSSRSPATAVRGHSDQTEIVLSPRSENVLDGRPTFLWHEDAPGSRYELECYQRDTRVWGTQSAETHADYPTHRAPLKPGRYRWQLSVTTPSGNQDMDVAEFTVLDAAAARKARAEVAAAQSLIPPGAGVNLPLISVYGKHRLFTLAEAALQRALDSAPDDKILRQVQAYFHLARGGVIRDK